MNKNKYPVLSKMAFDILSVPATSVASESTFSTSGRIISDYRSSLAPSQCRALVCYNDWLHAKVKYEWKWLSK